MFQSRFFKCAPLLLVALFTKTLPAQTAPRLQKFPFAEKLTYRIEWRLITAGSATIDLVGLGTNSWQTSLKIESAGVMTRLYKVLDSYKVSTDAKFCGANSFMDAQEGKRHTQTRLTFENGRRKLKYDEHDLVKNVGKQSELDIPPCAYEIAGALSSLRISGMEPGKSTTLAVTDGKKVVNGRVEAQAKETLTIEGKSFQTVRYEAFLFDNVLYRRKGRLLIWLTDDNDRLPVQLRLQLGFPVGNVTILLEKQQKM